MSIKIERKKQRKQTTFFNLPCGVPFTFSGNLYLKISHETNANNCVLLEDKASATYCEGGAIVQQVAIAITIEE